MQDFGASTDSLSVDNTSNLEDLLREYRGIQEEVSNFSQEIAASEALRQKLLSDYADGNKDPLESATRKQMESLQVFNI